MYRVEFFLFCYNVANNTSAILLLFCYCAPDRPIND